jgi:uncharacterized protein (UPF0335 family)
MNLMTLQRYRNEIILFVAFLFALFAFFYKKSASSYVEENRANIQQQITDITAIENYKGMWDGKSMANKVKVLKTIVPASKVESFNKKSKKLVASYANLTADELNKLTNKLINMPVQIVSLKINESSKNIFTMECTCKW